MAARRLTPLPEPPQSAVTTRRGSSTAQASTPLLASLALLDVGQSLPDEPTETAPQLVIDAATCLKLASRAFGSLDGSEVEHARLIPGALWGLAKFVRADPSASKWLASTPSTVEGIVVQAACVARSWEESGLSPLDLASMTWSLNWIPVAVTDAVYLGYAREVFRIASEVLSSSQLMDTTPASDLLQLLLTVAGPTDPLPISGERKGLTSTEVTWHTARKASMRGLLCCLVERCLLRIPDFAPDALAALLSVLRPYVVEVHPLSPPAPSRGSWQAQPDLAGQMAARCVVASLEEAARQLLRGQRSAVKSGGDRGRQEEDRAGQHWTPARVAELLEAVRRMTRPRSWRMGSLRGFRLVKAAAGFVVAAIDFMSEVSPKDARGGMKMLESLGGVAHLCAVPPLMLRVAAPHLAERLLATAALDRSASLASFAMTVITAAALGGDLVGPKAEEALVPRVVLALAELSGQGLNSLRLAASLLRAMAENSAMMPSNPSPLELACFHDAALAVAGGAVRSLQALLQCQDEVVLPTLLCAFTVLGRQGARGIDLCQTREVTELFRISFAALAQPLDAKNPIQPPLFNLSPLTLSDTLWACGHLPGAVGDKQQRADLARHSVSFCSENLIWWATLASHGDAPLSSAVARFLWAAVALAGVSDDVVRRLREAVSSGTATAGPAKVLLTLSTASWVDLDTVVAILWVLAALGLLPSETLASQLLSLRGRASSGSAAMPSSSWTWAILWELLLLAALSPGHGVSDCPPVWLEHAPRAWAVERATMQATRLGLHGAEELRVQLSTALTRLGVQHDLEAEVARGYSGRGVVVDAVLHLPSGKAGSGNGAGSLWCVELVDDSDAPGPAVREATDPRNACGGRFQVKRLVLAQAGCRILELSASLLASNGGVAVACEGLAAVFGNAGVMLPAVSSSELVPPRIDDREDAITESRAVPSSAASTADGVEKQARIEDIEDEVPTKAVTEKVSPAAATGGGSHVIVQVAEETAAVIDAPTEADASPQDRPGIEMAPNSTTASLKQAEGDHPTTAMQAGADADSAGGEVAQRRVHEATFRAECLARQRMEELRQRAQAAMRRAAEQAKVQPLAAHDGKRAAVDSNMAGGTGYDTREDGEDASSSLSEGSDSEESAESSEGKGSLGSAASNADFDEQRDAQPNVLSHQVSAAEPSVTHEWQTARDNRGRSFQDVSPPPGVWNERPVPRLPVQQPGHSPPAAAPFPPSLPPSRTRIRRACSPIDAPQAVAPEPGAVVIEFAGHKRRRVTMDASLTLKDLFHNSREFAADGRQLCITDCVSAETFRMSKRCPVSDRPVLYLGLG